MVVIHKSSRHNNNVPVIIEYKEEIPEKFEDYRVKSPIKGKEIVELQSGQRSRVHISEDFTNSFGTWHMNFQAPKDKYISIIIAVQRSQSRGHREIGVESQHCAYAGFAVYNDSALLGEKSSLGPFCGKWWSSDDKLVRDGKYDWTQSFITSAQNSINLMFYRFFDPDEKVTLHIIARTTDCPGRLVTCARPADMKPLSPVEPVVNFEKCISIYIYLQKSSISECRVTVNPTDKSRIEVRDLRMSSAEQAKRPWTHVNITKPPTLDRRDCRQTIGIENEETGDESIEPNKIKGFSFNKLIVKSEAKECFLTNLYARLFLFTTDCIHETFSTAHPMERKFRKYSEPCGSIRLPSVAKGTEILKFELHNPDVDYYSLRFATDRCAPDVTPKIVVHIDDGSIPQAVTLHPKSTFASRSRTDLISWNSGSNGVMLTVTISGTGNSKNKDCPLLFKFAGNKKEVRPSPTWNSTDKRCSFKPDKNKETVLRIPVNTNNRTWRETEKYCQTLGGHILSIETEALMKQLEQAAITGDCDGHVKSLYSASMLFIGLHDLKKVYILARLLRTGTYLRLMCFGDGKSILENVCKFCKTVFHCTNCNDESMYDMLIYPNNCVLAKHLSVSMDVSLIQNRPTYLTFENILQVNNYWWTSCEKPKYNKWRNPGQETATVSSIQAEGSSIFTDPLLREIWDKNRKEPISNRKYRCSAMILLSPNMDPVWIKVPCDYKFAKATAVCTKTDIAKESCSRELPKQDSEGNDLRKRGPQWNRNITCSKGWVLNQNDLKCYQLFSFLPNFEKTNLYMYTYALSKCEQLNGTVARITEDSLPGLNKLLVTMKVKPEYGDIWIQEEPKQMQENIAFQPNRSICSTLYPGSGADRNLREIGRVPCNRLTLRNPTFVASVLCQGDHRFLKPLPMQVLYQCLDGSFILKLHTCDKTPDCKDGSDETFCGWDSESVEDFQCPPLYYRCENSKQCISWSKVCDHRKDCLNSSSDESFCSVIIYVPGNTLSLHFRCKNGKTIELSRKCDTSYDCSDGSDETNCDNYLDSQCKGKFYDCQKHELIHVEMGNIRTKLFDALVRRGMRDLVPLGKCILSAVDMHPCDSFYDGCFKKSGLCVYDRLPNDELAYCFGGGHLQKCEDFVCPGKFKCEKSYCIPFQRVCDGIDDCPTGDDEVECNVPFCNNSFWCDGKCLSPENVCDNITHCVSGDDESMCDMLSCPYSCECLGHAIECINRNLTLLPDIQSKKLKALLFSNNFLNDTSMEKLGVYFLQDLLVLDLSSNRIENVNSNIFTGKGRLLYLYLQDNLLTVIPELCFYKLPNLQVLHISGNLIHTIQPKGFYGLRMITELNLSSMRIRDVGQHAFGAMMSLKYLNISLNRIKYIGPNVFQDLTKLAHLNLSGNSLRLIDPSTFQILTKLESLHTDDYKFCCAAPQVNSCLPRPDVYSSCDDLMSSGVLRAFIWLLGFFSLIGNVAVVCYRSQMEKPTVLSFLVHNLGVADFMMGMYLLIIASADLYYRGVYYLHDSIWRSHFMCRAAGFLSMLSSEMSVYVLVLITTDRVLTVGLGRNSFSDFTVKVLVLMGWAVFILLSLLPVTNISYFGIDEYIRHGVCFLFNLTEGKVSGWEYATTIFVAFNMFALFYLAIGYSFTFVSVLTRTGLSSDVEVQLARKLALVVLTDCVCWIPPITIGIISLNGQPIDPQVSMWIAVFIFPINSSLNPFLYTFSTCGKKPGQADDDSHDDDGVTQIDANKECNSFSDEDAAAGGTSSVAAALDDDILQKHTTKAVRFISLEDREMSEMERDGIRINFNASNDMPVAELVDYPIARVNSADSGIEAFCIEYDSRSPAMEHMNRNNTDNTESDAKYADTAF